MREEFLGQECRLGCRYNPFIQLPLIETTYFPISNTYTIVGRHCLLINLEIFETSKVSEIGFNHAPAVEMQLRVSSSQPHLLAYFVVV